MKYVKNLTVFALLVLTFPCQGQQSNDKTKIEALFVKSQKLYENNPKFRMSLEYKLFPTASATTVSEKYSGEIIKSGENNYSRIGTTEFIKFNKGYLKIDNESKLMQFTAATELPSNDIYNITNMVNNFNSFSLQSDGDYWKCVLTAPEISFVPYGKAIIYVRKSDNSIAKQVLFLLQKTTSKNEKGKSISDFPRMEISVGAIQPPNAVMIQKLQIGNYLQKNKPAKKYPGYTIVD